MCGIVGYIGPQSVVPVIIEGLRRLEYRGYDSAGIAVAGGPSGLELRRAPGKLRNLETVIHDSPIDGTFGIGHTRWATHGRPTEENAHPHRDGSGTLVVVHNGIVENYLSLKSALIAKGHKFVSETDTEIIAHLIEDELEMAGGHAHVVRSQSANESEAVVSDGTSSTREALTPVRPALPLEEAVRRAVKRITGAFAIGVLSAHEPNKLVAARMGPPAVIGIGEGEFFLASDVPGILHHTRNIHFLADGELAVLTKEGVTLTDFDAKPLPLKVQRITWDPIQAEKAGYKHFMLKEINEQPRAIRDTTLGRVSLETGKVFLEAMQISNEDLRNASQITIAACGTSWHAGLAGKFMIERLARLPVEVDYASEYRYRDPIADPRAIGLLITQSGETADTLAAQAELAAKGSKTLAICNVVGAAITRKAQGTLTTNAGPEIGVASTKAFTAQLTALFVLALHLAQVRGTISDEESLHLVTELSKLPGKLASMLNINSPDSPGSSEGVAAPARPTAPIADRRSTTRQPLSAQCEELARLFHTSNDFLFLGRGIHYPIALEGALKLKEISYIHAEGYPAGEMKHGPNALIDESLPVVCIATKDPNDPSSVLKYEKTLSNIQEVTARSGRDQPARRADHLHPPGPRTTPTHPRSSPPPTPRLPHSRPPRLRRRPTQKLSEKRHGGVRLSLFQGNEQLGCYLKAKQQINSSWLDFDSWRAGGPPFHFQPRHKSSGAPSFAHLRRVGCKLSTQPCPPA
jgi:glutamine---fructose-6-phosphate transaminase (isomerizing)